MAVHLHVGMEASVCKGLQRHECGDACNRAGQTAALRREHERQQGSCRACQHACACYVSLIACRDIACS